MADHDPMTVGASYAKLAHMPRLVRNSGAEVRSLSLEVLKIAVGIFHSEIGEIAVTAQRTRRHIVGTFPQHNHTVVLLHEYPTRRLSDNLEAEHLNVEFSRSAHVVNRKDVVIL